MNPKLKSGPKPLYGQRMIPTTIFFPPDLLGQVDKAAKDSKSSRQQITREAIQKGLGEIKGKGEAKGE